MVEGFLFLRLEEPDTEPLGFLLGVAVGGDKHNVLLRTFDSLQIALLKGVMSNSGVDAELFV